MDLIMKLMFIFILFHVNTATIIWDNSTQIISKSGYTGDEFGFSIALNKDRVVVGSPSDDQDTKENIGSFSIYTLNGNGFQLQSKLVPSDGQTRDSFGCSVGLNVNNLIIVGSKSGKVHVYRQDGQGWGKEDVVANDITASDFFGEAVDINDDNEAVVGAWGDADKGGRAGSAYIFTYIGNKWTPHQKLVPSDLSGSDYFGRSVSMTTTHLAVGADGQDGASGTFAGSVYIYKKHKITQSDNHNIWHQQIKLRSPNSASVYFGVALHLDDERLIVGVKQDDSNTGRAYVYVTDGNTWTLEATLVASDRKTEDFFGSAVSINKHAIVIGAYATNYKGRRSGSAYVFQLTNNGTWEEIAQLVAYDGRSNDNFGRRAVSVFNERVAIGAEYYDYGNKGDFGAVYIFNDLPFATATATPPSVKTNSLIDSKNFSIVCDEVYMSGIWNKKQFSGRGNVSITLRDVSCNNYHHNNTHMWITANFTQCGTVTIENSLRIIQENTATVTLSHITGNIIRRQSFYNYNIRCEFVRTMNISSGSSSNSYNVTDRGIHLGTINESLVTDFSVDIAIYTNSMFTEIASNPITVTLSQPIYIGISESRQNKLLKFVVHTCFATPSPDINDIRYTFFHQKCRYDASFVIIDNNNNHFNFKIDAFTFIEITKSVHIHCQLYICTSSATSEACQQSCRKRNRRAVPDKVPLKEVTLITNEIKFEKKISCKELLCPSYSSCMNTYPATCRCYEGYVLISTTNVCENKRLFYIDDLHLDMKFSPLYLDTTGTIFINFANKIEKQLNYFIFQLGEGTITGLQVIRARPGSGGVIIDLAVIYAKHSTKEIAYKTFVKSINKNHTETLNYRNELKIKTSIIPTMTGGPSTEHLTSDIV